MSAPNCKDSVALLLEYLDGELNADLRVKLEAHLSGCSPCEDFWKSYSATPGLCRKALIAEMPREVETKLTDFLRLEMNKSK